MLQDPMSSIGKPLTTGIPSSPDQSDPDSPVIEIQLESGDEGYEPEDDSEGTEITIQEFDGNLAEDLEPGILNKIGTEIVELVEEDKQGREKWEMEYRDSLQYLGLKSNESRSTPWQGACAVVAPMMLEGIVRFQSRALGKLYPSNGPAVLNLKGIDITPQLQIAVGKAQGLLNDHITLVMQETQTESDRLLFGLAQIGWAAKKVYYDEFLQRTVTQFIPAEDFLLPYSYDNLETCPRYTHEVRRTRSEVEQLQESGFYLDIVLHDAQEELSSIEEAKSRMLGQEISITNKDGVRLYEVYINYSFEEDMHSDGKILPYVITIDKDTNKILSIRRNWREEDSKRGKILNFARYIYVPSDGSYGLGLVQLVGQLSSAATKLLRQLIDAGTLANLPALFKSRDARMNSQGPLTPGELRDVEIDAEQLSKAFFPLPFKEPSQTLLTLLTMIIAEAKSFSSTADLDISAGSQSAPVGTTLALLERQTEVSNAVQKRMHTSFGQELRLIVEFIKDYEPEVYNSIFGDLLKINPDMSIIVVPSGDPTSSTMSQRILQLQAVAQQAQQAPGVFDLGAVARAMVSAMGLPDVDLLVPDKNNQQPQDAISENMGFFTGKPAKAFPFQDHDSHITIHMSLLNDQKYAQEFQGSPQAAALAAGMQSHIAEHYAFSYRNAIEKQLGTQLPPIGTPDNPQIESALSSLVANAATQVAQQHAAEAQQQKAQQQAADPAFQLEQQELQLKAQSEANKMQMHQMKIASDEKRDAEKNAIQKLQILSQEKVAVSAQMYQQASKEVDQDVQMHTLAHNVGSTLLNHAQHLDNNQVAQQQADTQQTQAENPPPPSGGQ
jgi:hypothetical protein